MSARVAVLQFPGSNCEVETKLACEFVGLKAEIFRWNNTTGFKDFDAFILPGGFSYEDRVRAGAIAAKNHILDELITQADLGKPVLGICNGAQILVEAGLVPGIKAGKVEIALAPNEMPNHKGYFTHWTHLLVTQTTPFTIGIPEVNPIPVPMAHGEGRFTSNNSSILDSILNNHLLVLQYANPDGTPTAEFPANPNLSWQNAAGICNTKRNVLAMMPHPERSTWSRQIPLNLAGYWGQQRIAAQNDFKALESFGPGAYFFKSLHKWFK